MNQKLKNIYTFEGWEQRNGIWVRFWHASKENIVVTTGLNEIQNKFWKGVAYTATPYVGLITNTSFGSIALANTAAKIVTVVPGGADNQWREFTGYSESLRQALTMGTSTAGAIDSSASVAVFTVTTDFTLNGAFVATSSVKGGTGGILIGAASASSTQAFVIGQQVRIIIASTLANE